MKLEAMMGPKCKGQGGTNTCEHFKEVEDEVVLSNRSGPFKIMIK